MIKINKDEKAKKLRDTLRILERSLGLVDDNQLSCCNLSLAQCHGLVEIGRSGIISLNQLAECLQLDTSTMSRTVNHLVQSGLAERTENPDDRRYININLSKQGIKHFNAIETMMDGFFKDILQDIPDEKQDQIIESVQLLTKCFQNKKCCKLEAKNEE